MAEKHSAQKLAARTVLHKALSYVEKDPEKNLVKLADKISLFFKGLFPPENFEKMKKVAEDPDNVWHQFALGLIKDLNMNVIEQMLVSLGIDAGYYGTKTVRENREKYKCNIPLLFFLTLQAHVTLNARAVGRRNTDITRALQTSRCSRLFLRARSSAPIFICLRAASRLSGRTI